MEDISKVASNGQLCGAFVKKIEAYGEIDEVDLLYLPALCQNRRKIPAGSDLPRDGERPRIYLMSAGWAYSYHVLRDGGRQVLDFRIPGDFIGINSTLLRRRQNPFAAITDVELGEFSQHPMIGMPPFSDRLARAIMWTVSRDSAQIEEHLIDLGRRSALARTAHLLLELGDRLKLVGLGHETGYDCPLSQTLLADALGLTPVHVNRMLRELREMGCMTFRNGYVSFDDLPRLVEVAEYDPAYLDQNSAALAGG